MWFQFKLRSFGIFINRYHYGVCWNMIYEIFPAVFSSVLTSELSSHIIFPCIQIENNWNVSLRIDCHNKLKKIFQSWKHNNIEFDWFRDPIKVPQIKLSFANYNPRSRVYFDKIAFIYLTHVSIQTRCLWIGAKKNLVSNWSKIETSDSAVSGFSANFPCRYQKNLEILPNV